MPELEFESVYKDTFPFWDMITDAEKEYICQNRIRFLFQKKDFYTANVPRNAVKWAFFERI